MGAENDIRRLLQQGFTPNQLIAQEFARSTVYKVYNSIRTYNNRVVLPPWIIQNIRFDRPDARYLPGSSLTMGFDFLNNSGRSMYLRNIGVRTEWMQPGFWVCQLVDDVVRNVERRPVSLRLNIPDNISLGEQSLLFGVESQYLPVQSLQDQAMTTTWTEPYSLKIKHPQSGNKVFLSHSVKDAYTIRTIKNLLDNYGIEVIIGDDEERPGMNLQQKFIELINSCNIFIAILTRNAMLSDWVKWELNYAHSINKPLILLKEESVILKTNLEWIPFSQNTPPNYLLELIMNAINKVKGDQLPDGLLTIVASAVLGFIAGYYLAPQFKKSSK